ncbi:MAG: tetratricopeptide repeat protein [Anaerolineae bacterium]|nr:tetratricopeptide repeat protein [Anaerolineae bacterium]
MMDEPGCPDFFGDWLKQRRKALDLTQAELAQRAGCSVFALRKIESGERRPSKQLAQLLAASLGVPPEDRDTFVRVARGEAASDRLQRFSVVSSAPLRPLPPSVVGLHSGLPLMLTPFIGREPELAALQRLLDDPLCRLITLIGAGGIGKTRLAMEVASREQAHFSDGVFFVPLASLGSSAYLVPAIADALDFAFQGQTEPRIQLLNHLCHKRLLLVLDNAEHLLDSVRLFAEVLQHAPGVKLLVTSRERLNLQSEWVYVVQGLAVPPTNQAQGAGEYTAIQLFVQSARRTDAGFELTEDERSAVVRICQLVEGMPLGIELAATWVSALSCREIAKQIAQGLDFLATSMRDVPARQRSLRAVFDHSWSLLSADEQSVLSRLAVFRGGFARDAAEQVAGASLTTLLALQSKSLLRRKGPDHLELHEVVRQYALSHLERSSDHEATCQKQCQFYLTLLRDQEMRLQGTAQLETVRRLKAEIENIHVAWGWAVRHGEFSLIDGALRSLGWLCHIGVLYQEGIDEIELVVQTLPRSSEDQMHRKILGKALTQQGMLYFRQGNFHRAIPMLEESITILRPLGMAALMPDPLVLSGVIMHLNGDFERAQRLMEEAYDKAQEVGDQFYAAYALFNLGFIAGLRGQCAEGYEQMLAGLELWRQLGDSSSLAMGLNFLGLTAVRMGRLEEAQAFLQESLAVLTPLGDRWGLGNAYRFLGLAALRQGFVDDAILLIRRSLDLFEGTITGWDVACSLIYLGEAIGAAGQLTEAEGLLRHGLRMAIDIPALPLVQDALAGLAHLSLEAGEVATAWEISAIVEAHPAVVHWTKQRTRRIRAEVEAMVVADPTHPFKLPAEPCSLGALIEKIIGW